MLGKEEADGRRFVFIYAGGASPALYAALVGLGVLAVAVYVYYRRGLRRWKL